MTLIADILLAAAAFGAAFYCFTLGRRLKKFNNLEAGMGGAVAVLSAQVDDLERILKESQGLAERSVSELSSLTDRADEAARRIELQIASVHDIDSELGSEVGPKNEAPPGRPQPMFTRHKAVRDLQ